MKICNTVYHMKRDFKYISLIVFKRVKKNSVNTCLKSDRYIHIVVMQSIVLSGHPSLVLICNWNFEGTFSYSLPLDAIVHLLRFPIWMTFYGFLIFEKHWCCHLSTNRGINSSKTTKCSLMELSHNLYHMIPLGTSHFVLAVLFHNYEMLAILAIFF